MKKNVPSWSSQSGATLIEILFSVAILGLGSSVFLQYSKTTMANRGAAELIRQKTLITTMLVNGTVCSKTAECHNNDWVELKDVNERVLVSADGKSQYGPFSVRAECQKDKTIQVRVAAPLGKNKFRNDPLTGKPMNWDTKSGIILESGALCGTLEKVKKPGNISLIRSARCTVDKGSCTPPKIAVEYGTTLTSFCCDDGRDIPKPSCGSGKELGSYWDREGNWGAEGSWVVFCE